jgi:hypothetical protein
MKKAILLTFFVFALSVGVFAQTDVPRKYIDKDNRVFWKNNDSSCCDSLIIDGETYDIFKKNDLFIVFNLDYVGDYQIMSVLVGNNSDKRITVKAEDTSLEIWKSFDDMFIKPPTVLPPIDAARIASKMKSRQRLRNAFSALGASMATQNATIRNNQTGQSATVTVPDTSTQNAARRNAEINSTETEASADGVMDTALKSNTLFSGQRTAGSIYFKYKKHGAEIFILKIEGVEYAFISRFSDGKK